MSNAINALDKEDQENLQFILQKMYPESKNFKELLPTLKTLELYIQAVSANNFCNKAMTQLTTELLSASVSQIYKGRLKQVVKKVLKEIKGYYQKNNVNFFICNQVVKYKYKSPLVISLHGFY